MKIDHPIIGIFGHYGNHNLGDESIIEASISQVRKRLPNAEVCCFSLRPEDSACRHQVESYRILYSADGVGPISPEQAPPVEEMPWNIYFKKVAQGENQNNNAVDNYNSIGFKKWIKCLPVISNCLKALISAVRVLKKLKEEIGYLFKSFRYLKKFDLIVIAGSNQFLDHFGGPWKFPYTLLKWALLAKLTGTKTAFVSIGANPLENSLSRKMIHAALRRADYISYRDEASKDLIEDGAPGFSGEVYPDLAFGLNYILKEEKKLNQKPLIGINPMPVYDYRYWHVRDDSQYHAYVVKLTRFAENLITEGYPITFFPTMWRDNGVIIDILKEMNENIRSQVEEKLLVTRFNEVSELIELLQHVDIVVSTRFHATLLSLLVHTPVLGISYYRKNIDLMNAFGQDEYHEVLENFNTERLWQKFIKLSENIMPEKNKIRSKTKEYQNLIGEQWDRVINLIS